MDTAILIKNLNEVLCKYNKNTNKYSEAWLSEVDFGGLYNNGKFSLCLKAEHQIDSCFDETREIIELLKKEAKKEFESIWTIRIYDNHDRIHCEESDLRVYSEATAC